MSELWNKSQKPNRPKMSERPEIPYNGGKIESAKYMWSAVIYIKPIPMDLLVCMWYGGYTRKSFQYFCDHEEVGVTKWKEGAQF